MKEMCKMEKLNLSWNDCEERAEIIARAIMEEWVSSKGPIRLYGIPRGGIPAAQLVSSELWKLNCHNRLMSSANNPNYFIDDIIDTGSTKNTHIEAHDGETPFYALVDYQGRDKSLKGTWISFPWERMTNDDGPVENVRRLIEYIGDDPERD